MYVVYNFKNDKKVKLFLWSDILGENNFRTSTEGYVLQKNSLLSGQEIKFQIKKNSDDKLFFEYDREIKLFEDFEFMSVDELILKLNKVESNTKVTQDEIFATFMKDTENVGILMQVTPLEPFALQFGMAMYSHDLEKDPTMLCVPTERRFKKNNWNYKFTVEVVDEEARPFYASKDFYFSDFASILRTVTAKENCYKIKLVNRNTYLEEIQEQSKSAEQTNFLEEKVLRLKKKMKTSK